MGGACEDVVVVFDSFAFSFFFCSIAGSVGGRSGAGRRDVWGLGGFGSSSWVVAACVGVRGVVGSECKCQYG